MVAVERIQKEVKEYHFKHAVGDVPADAFAAWWLTRRFDVAPIDAVKRATGGAYDFRIDGFHLEEGEKPILHLFQAKFTSSRAEIKKGFDGFCKTMELLPELLDRRRCSAPQQNTLLPRLALLLDQHADLIPRLVLQFRVLHLSDDDSTSLEQYLTPTLERFDDNASNHMPDHLPSCFRVACDRTIRRRFVKDSTRGAQYSLQRARSECGCWNCVLCRHRLPGGPRASIFPVRREPLCKKRTFLPEEAGAVRPCKVHAPNTARYLHR